MRINLFSFFCLLETTQAWALLWVLFSRLSGSWITVSIEFNSINCSLISPIVQSLFAENSTSYQILLPSLIAFWKTIVYIKWFSFSGIVGCPLNVIWFINHPHVFSISIKYVICRNKFIMTLFQLIYYFAESFFFFE